MLTRKMKDSGIEWIGKIPEDWEVVKLGIVADISTGNTPKDPDNIKYSKSEGVDWLKTNNLLGVDGVSNSSLKIKEQYISEARLTNPGSVLVTCIGDIGKLGYTSKPMAFNQQINAITFTKDIVYWKYGMYTLYSQREQQESFANGNVLKILNRENQKKVVITVPNDINKQIKISNALDKICLYIRKIVDKTQQSIEELKKYKQSLITEAVTKGLDPNVEMKDSGIEWIGKLPIHWTVSKVKQFYKVVSGGTPKSNNTSYWDGDIVWITPADYQEDDVYVAKSNRTISMEGVQNSSAEIVPRNSIIVSNRAPIGKIALTDIELSTNQGCKAMVNKKNINNKFIYYFMYIMQEVLEEFGHGTTFRELSTEALKNFKFPVPCIEEQQQIVSYLDEQTSRIDKLIADKTKVIEELENYKKSLIYEYVTGKKEV